MELPANRSPGSIQSSQPDQNKPFDATDPKITRRRAFKKFVGYAAPAAIALLVARDASATTGP